MALSSVDVVEKVHQAGEAIDGWPDGEDAAPGRGDGGLAPFALAEGGARRLRLTVRGKGMGVGAGRGGRPPAGVGSLHSGRRAASDRRAQTEPTALGLAGQALAWADVRFRDRIHGALALTAPEEDRAGQEAAKHLLEVVGRLLAGRLEIEALERERGARTAAAAGDARMADFGEAAAMLGHEFNNFLNALLLHIAVMELKLPAEMHPGLKEVRRQALDAAALIHLFQNYRRRGQAPQETTDLNRAVRAGASELAGTAIRLDLADGELSLAAPRAISNGCAGFCCGTPPGRPRRPGAAPSRGRRSRAAGSCCGSRTRDRRSHRRRRRACSSRPPRPATARTPWKWPRAGRSRVECRGGCGANLGRRGEPRSSWSGPRKDEGFGEGAATVRERGARGPPPGRG